MNQQFELDPDGLDGITNRKTAVIAPDKPHTQNQSEGEPVLQQRKNNSLGPGPKPIARFIGVFVVTSLAVYFGFTIMDHKQENTGPNSSLIEEKEKIPVKPAPDNIQDDAPAYPGPPETQNIADVEETSSILAQTTTQLPSDVQTSVSDADLIKDEKQSNTEINQSNHHLKSIESLETDIRNATETESSQLEKKTLQNGPVQNKGTRSSPQFTASDVDDIHQPVERREIIVPFSFNKATPDHLSDILLHELEDFSKHCTHRIRIVGHTCSLGPFQTNLLLGQIRANTIRNLLLRLGIPADQIETHSAGETLPIAPNSSHRGRERNRRVVVDCPDTPDSMP